MVRGQWRRPKIRSEIQASTEAAWIVGERYGISEQTVWKWRKRDSVFDRSHTPHRLQTTLTPAQEVIAVELRRLLLLPLDDLLVLAIGLEPMAPSMARCASSSIRTSRARGSTAVCAGMGSGS